MACGLREVRSGDGAACDRGSCTETLRSARHPVPLAPGQLFPLELLVIALVLLQHDLFERLLPARLLLAGFSPAIRARTP